VGYGERDLEALRGGPVIACVGRFTAVKRLPLLVRAWAQATERIREPASLVLVGGYPGEWEIEHPLQSIATTGAQRIYLAGWHDHQELPELLSASDAIVLASVREQFGSVLVEGMACGLPAIAVDRLGPSDIVRPAHTGWLAEPDDEAALAGALAQAIAHPEERLRRGAAARRDVLARFAWPALADRLCALFTELAEGAAGDEAATAAADS
jgi:glycosyltransferase involved in cell wall biosynthesis